MSSPIDTARMIWEVGVLVRGDTVGGRLALERATDLHANLEGVGESRLIRAAVEAAMAGGPADASQAALASPGLKGIAWPDRLVWIARVRRADIEAAFPSTEGIVRPLEFSAERPPHIDAIRTELDRLWKSHGQDACGEALSHARARSRVGSALALIALLLFVSAMIFVVHDLMRGAEREREFQEQAEQYSVPDEAIEPAPAP